MNMKKILHRALMTNNQLTGSKFSKTVQEKLNIFNKMHNKLDEVADERKEKLLDQLYELDIEIYEDMIAALEDELENNELTEDELDETPHSKTIQNDEHILDELKKMKRTKGLKRSFLIESGIKTPIQEWTVKIGKHTLNRTKIFTYTYDLR